MDDLESGGGPHRITVAPQHAGCPGSGRPPGTVNSLRLQIRLNNPYEQISLISTTRYRNSGPFLVLLIKAGEIDVLNLPPSTKHQLDSCVDLTYSIYHIICVKREEEGKISNQCLFAPYRDLKILLISSCREESS